jgi:hypothetical protein
MYRRRLIEREHAASYIFTLMISFAAAILVTRLFLELTGYPQIGNSKLHIAHVLWGGLIVAVGAALPLIFSNTFIFRLSSILSGVGLGLFFDEVGKFLTQDNDYFFRPAASIIYILFLIGIYVYITVRRGEPDDRTRLYHALAAMQEIVDGDLDVSEKGELEKLLSGVIGDAAVPDMRELAGELLDFVQRQADTIPDRTPRLQRWLHNADKWLETHLLTRATTRWLLILSALLLAALSLIDAVSLIASAGQPERITQVVQGWIARSNLTSAQEALWYAAMIALKIAVGLTLVGSLVLFGLRKDRQAITLALTGLLLSITALNVVLFYFEQFLAALYAIADFAVLAGLNFYNQHFLKTTPPANQKT